MRTDAGDVAAGVVVSTLNVWSPLLRSWVAGAEIPCRASRHLVASFAADAPYTRDVPVLKDFGLPLMLYSRPHAGSEILVGSGDAGDEVADPDGGTGDISMDWVAEVGAHLAHRLPRFAEHGRFATAWAGLYDTTPDWNPVLGPLPGVEGCSSPSASPAMASNFRPWWVGCWRRPHSGWCRICRCAPTAPRASRRGSCWSAPTARARCPRRLRKLDFRQR